MMFQQIDPKQLTINPFEAIDRQWMLITAGGDNRINTMTASWGGMGVLWNKNTATCYIRPQRYTREFVDAQDYFSLSFLPAQYRSQLVYCGRTSGRDEDKIAKAGLTVCREFEAPCFEEAELALICKKIYVGAIRPEGIVDAADDAANYPAKDYHIVYIGEIVKALTK